MREKNEVVRVADVVLCLHFMLYELIEFVHVDIHEELAGEISERKPFSERS